MIRLRIFFEARASSHRTPNGLLSINSNFRERISQAEKKNHVCGTAAFGFELV